MTRIVVSAAAFVAVLSGCSSSSSAPAPAPTAAASAATPTGSPTSAAPEHTVWLCRPGPHPDTCDRSRASTAFRYDGSREVEPAPAQQPDDLDCFYVYPTVSQERQPNADLRIRPEQEAVAFAQASRFSDVCRVWAPMYRQRTVHGLFDLSSETAATTNQIALDSLTAAWRDYLAHDNHGREIVLIGHSQGAAMLIRLLREQVDPDPAVRDRIALAILLGGNVTVRTGELTGGSFEHLPLCTRQGQVGCVIAYSSFLAEPPPFSFFARPGLGVSMLSGETADGTTSVACVNPGALSGGRSTLHPYVPRELVGQLAPELSTFLDAARTPWASLPDTYTGRCRTSGTATWLQVTPAHGTSDPRAQLQESLGRQWGLHIVDVNLALGDLVADVRAVAQRLR